MAAHVDEGVPGAVGEPEEVDPVVPEGRAHVVAVVGCGLRRVLSEVGARLQLPAALGHRLRRVHPLETRARLVPRATQRVRTARSPLVDEHDVAVTPVLRHLCCVQRGHVRSGDARAAFQVEQRCGVRPRLRRGNHDHPQGDAVPAQGPPVLGHLQGAAAKRLAHPSDLAGFKMDRRDEEYGGRHSHSMVDGGLLLTS
jgi:hypothetical protein